MFYECDIRNLPEPVDRQMMLAGQRTGVNDLTLIEKVPVPITETCASGP